LYFAELKSRRYKKATVARKFAAVKSFFRYLVGKGVILSNPSASLEQPKVNKTLPKPLTVRQIRDLLEQPSRKGTVEALRDSAILELLYTTGLGVSELAALNKWDISLYMNSTHVSCAGKGAKKRTVPLDSADCRRALLAYLKDGRPKLTTNPSETAFFVSRYGNRLTRNSIWQNIKQYAKDAGIEAPVTPNTLRQSFATHMLISGVPVGKVQRMLGHASVNSTKIYNTGATNRRLRRVYQAAHPRARS
jgi:integrase/recombinase XerD